ncbi:MAG TPA: hypothetical protein VMF05_13805 [Stellaceae bacterium]|nr:hypothetical protein [Stellaceae bacterium]
MVDEAADNVIGRGRFPSGAGGSGPRDPGTEARLSILELAVDEIRTELRGIRVDLAEIKGRLSNTQAGLILAIFAGCLDF